MPVTAIIGAQWGDEGKGKITDLLSQNMDLTIRANGADNAGHTVRNEYGEFKLHLTPCGIFNPRCLCIIGNGVAINPKVLIGEINELHSRNVGTENLRISNRAHLIIDWHTTQDRLEEESRGKGKIGTTQKGVGPVFSDKAARFGLRVGDLLDKEKFEKRFKEIYERKEKLFRLVYKYKDFKKADDILEEYFKYRETLLPYIIDAQSLIWEALDENKNILLEGAQATLLDIDFGTYPYTTSSPCTLAGLCQGSGIPWSKITEVIGVVKGYTTRVGEKVEPFPTEMAEDIANPFREKTNEFGATTGRPRRIGWLDLVGLKYTARINGFTSLAIMRLDSLAGLPFVNACYAYKLKNGEIVQSFPYQLEDVEKPVYLSVFGWPEGIKDCQKYSDLFSDHYFNAGQYLTIIENFVGVSIKYVSIGPEREQTLVRE